ncbi:MAG TPA: MFS transporter [Candidatus Limnocylindrales bacterium]
MPWLALVLTGSGLALGTVLALMAVPRAALMIIGGAYTDRLSPRRVMLLSNAVRLVAVSLLAGAVLEGAAQLWMLYAFALVFGIADAFFFPAQTSIVPALVPSEQLGQANAIVQGTAQLSVFLGPAVAGIMIAALGSSAATPSTQGLGVAFVVDALSFLASLATLWLIRRVAQTAAAQATSVVSAIGEAVRFIWNWPSMRLIVVLSMLLNLLIVGPVEVGMPVLAYARLPEGAAAFGTITALFGLGSLIGLGAAAALPAPRPALFSTFAIGAIALAGVFLALMGTVFSTLPALAVAFGIGVTLGFSNLLTMTWIQRRVPGTLMGRVMSVLMLGSLGLVPVSEFIAGVFVQVNLTGLLLVGGGGMAVVALISLLSPAIRSMGHEPTIEQSGSAAAA